MSKTSVAAPSTVMASRMTTLALALVVVVELGGAFANPQAPRLDPSVVAADGATVYAPAAPRVASVEISIVAQADTPAH